jgi:hypothetical protein
MQVNAKRGAGGCTWGKEIDMTKMSDRLQFKVPFEGKPDKQIEISMYVFDSSGEFLTAVPVRDGQIEIAISKDHARWARILLAPTLEEKRKLTPTRAMLERLQAYEPKWLFDPNVNTYELLPIPDYIWKKWLWCRCRVRGRVVKPVSLNGVTQNMPVCHARVHICEVDPLIIVIPRLPEDIIFRLRDELIQFIEWPFPRPPLPDPPPFRYDPGVIDPSPEAIAGMNRSVQIPSQEIASGGMSLAMLNPQPEPPIEAMPSRMNQVLPDLQPLQSKALDSSLHSPLPPAIKTKLLSPSMEIVKQSLLANVDLIRPYICWWPWLWPYFSTCDELVILETDHQGRFETDIWYLCFGDHPDLYFWVEFCIGGSWTSIYHPPILCNTYWDYVCGSDVIIHVTDPRVPWCGEPPILPGKQVAVMLIGNNISLHQIQGAAAGAHEGMTTTGRPFGGSLEPHVWFGDDLIATGTTHYQWVYRRLTLGDGVTAVTDAWHAMDRQVVRHYAVIDPTPPDFPLTFKPFLLGPDPVFPTQNLFKIQPKDAPAGSYGWAPMIDARENSASAFFLSQLLEGGDALAAAGKYELRLMLFNSAGNLVNLTDAGILLKAPAIDGPFGPGTVPTTAPAAEHLVLDGAGKIIGFRLVVRVDNNPCDAVIYDASVNGHAAGPCGFIAYPAGADVHLSFKARHPNNLARFKFTIVKGSSGYLNSACAPFDPTVSWTALPLVGDNPVNGYSRSPASIFSRDIPVATMVGACPGGKAAFGENLSVYVLATDGWNDRLQYLDAYALPKAFALALE